jgi:hypothetical protein
MLKYSKIKGFIKNNFLFVLIVSLSITLLFEFYLTRQKSIELNDVGFKYGVGIIKILENEIARNEYMNDENSKLDELRFINYLNSETRYNNLYDLCPRLHLYLLNTRNIFDYSHYLGTVLEGKITLEEMQKQKEEYIIW